MASEKVANMVGTFLNEYSDCFQKISIATTQTASGKVTNMVGTFLNEYSINYQRVGSDSVKVPAPKR